jgi:DNA-binding NtrC family response regulator
MARSILIVDDDTEFSGLLTGVFEQADYTVHTAANAKNAFDLLQRETVDLVVTDQRLPGMSGLEFIQQLEELEIHLPIIMVSGYLEDDSIRQLIRSGISGIFMKPLNIFSLLKKASDLLTNRAAVAQNSAAGEDTPAADQPLPRIAGIGGASEGGRSFLRKAMDVRGFKRQLLLIGPHGTLFEEVGKSLVELGDVRGRVHTIKASMIDAGRLNEIASQAGDALVTLIVLQAEQLNAAQIEVLEDFVDRDGGRSARMLLCLGDTVEALYDRGVIDEELYLFFGTSEIRVPALREMPEDVVEMVRDLLEESGPDARIDSRLRSFLTEREWAENMVELRSLTLKAINLASPLPPQLRHFEAAILATADEAVADRNPLERFLRLEKARYEEALEIITAVQAAGGR